MQFHLFAELLKGEKTADFSLEQLYYKEALIQYFPMELEKFKLEDFESTGTDYKIKKYIQELEESKDYSSILQFSAALPLKDHYLMVKEASAHQAMGDIEKAIEKAEALLKENEKDIDALLLYANALKEKGDWSKSTEYYQKVLEREPGNITGLMNAGICFIQLENYKDAYEYFKRASKIEPKYTSVWSWLGLAQFYLGEINDAVLSLFKALKLDKDDIRLKVAVTLIFSEKESVEKARGALQKILTDNPDDTVILETIAGIYQISDYFDEAIPLCEKLIQLKPGNALFHFQIVACFTGLNNILPALSHLEKALKLFDTGKKFDDSYLQVFWAMNHAKIFMRGATDNISMYLRQSLSLVEKFNYKNEFLESIPIAIFGLLKEHESMEVSRLEGIENILTEIFQDEKDMIVPLKFLNIGIRHLKRKEKNVLLQFTKEERETFKKFVLDKLNPAESV
jgi:tetratricopeptide (TPR) repeat protein